MTNPDDGGRCLAAALMDIANVQKKASGVDVAFLLPIDGYCQIYEIQGPRQCGGALGLCKICRKYFLHFFGGFFILHFCINMILRKSNVFSMSPKC